MLERTQVRLIETGKQYAVALVLALLAVALRFALDPWLGGHAVFSAMFAAIALSVWYGGVGPAIACAAVGYILCDYLFIAPRYTLTPTPPVILAAVVYFASAAAIIFIGERLRGASRRAAETALQLLEIEARLRVAEDNSPIAFALLRAVRESGRIVDFQFTYANASAGRNLRRAPEALVGRRLLELFPGHRDSVFDTYVKVVETGAPQDVELYYQADAVQGWFKNVASRHADGLAVWFMDITARKRAEEGLQRSEQQLRTITDALPVLISYVDADRRYVLNNASYERWFGRSRESMAGKYMWEVLGEEAYERIRPYVDRTLEGESAQFEVRLNYRDAGERDVSITYTPDVVDGQVVGMAVLVEDISQRKLADQALRESEARFRGVFDSRLMGLTIYNYLTGETLAINDTFLEMTGHTREQFERGDWDWREFTPEEFLEFDRRAVVQARERGWWDAYEKEYQRIDGSRFPVRVGSAPLPGLPGHVVVGVQDITERKATELALLEADRRKNEFLATLAHELRNPLAPIRNAILYLQLKGPPDAGLQSARAMIDRQVMHMTRLVDDLMDVSRITRGLIELRHEHVDLRAALASAIEACRPAIEAHRHTLQVSAPQEGLYVRGDPVRLTQVFGNLLNNAAKYTPSGGAIGVTLEVRGAEALVRVKDNGIGIPGEMLRSIFDMFVQVDSSFERSHGGLGIGLTLTQQLVRMHGGRVEARSEGRGRGSEFTVYLPLEGSAEAAIRERVEEVAHSRGARRILIADDNVDAAESLAMLLSSFGHEIKIAHDGAAALRLIQTMQPDAAVLDIGMPVLNGFELARRIRQTPHGQSMFLVALTGWGQEEDKRRARESGFDEHMTKPGDAAELISMLSKLPRAPVQPGAQSNVKSRAG